MRALAEFIMRGRLQAGTVAIFGYIIPLLAPAALALVTLRKGAYEGTIVLLLGLFPALLSIMLGESGSVVVWITLLTLLLVYVPAYVLRTTISLPMMILSSIITAIAAVFVVWLFVPNIAQASIDSLLSQLPASQQEDTQAPLSILTSQTGLLGMIAYVLAFNGFTGVLLGRWLQSIAFNPGGFGEEFRQLRLGLPISAFCFVASVLLRFMGNEYWWWSNLLAIPLLLVTIAIAHHAAKARELAAPWLVLFYIVVFMFMPMAICIGFVDTWMNFRDRLQKKQ